MLSATQHAALSRVPSEIAGRVLVAMGAGDTLDARLRRFYELEWCDLSVPELAALFTATDDASQVHRAHRRIRQTHRDQFLEKPQSFGRATVAKRRRFVSRDDLLNKPGGSRRSDLSLDPIDLRGDLELPAQADPARAHARAFRDRPPASERPRRKAVRRPDLAHDRLLAPLSLEAGVRDALERVHGRDGLAAVVRVLRELACHQHPTEAVRAARTLAQRAGVGNPGGYFRDLFRAACGGDLLCDAAAAAVELRDAESRAAVEHDAPIDVDAAELGDVGADELVGRAAAKMRERTPEQIYPGGLPPWERPQPKPEERRLAAIMGHLRRLPDDDPQRPALQREAFLLYQRGVRPAGDDQGARERGPPDD